MSSATNSSVSNAAAAIPLVWCTGPTTIKGAHRRQWIIFFTPKALSIIYKFKGVLYSNCFKVMSSLLTSTCCRAYFGDLAEFLQLSMYYLLNCNNICFRNILTNGFSTFSDCQELFFPANLPQFVYFFPSVPHAASHGRWILQRDHFQN